MDTIVRGTSVTIFAGIFCKVWSIPCAGSGIEQDAHDWPHITLVVSGSVRLTRGNGIVRDYVAGDVIQIPARQLHGFVTLTDNVQLACLHAINRADPKTLTETEN